ncbi:thiol-disulfide oxidoreductase DCC family protein [Sediminibacterium ginsengisoli]|uniref:Predicted thiol-disulfide oxidoreductase YuxK, DCC family n=1 Tax=Sediminibacterium ginsengisoli TaxID=413434 RepID=A0A1T4KAE6_9BACT|nr:thiol-disulfide oxidoreductase DCC family protein [Sediminibacterium ginsengisoli]SJZ39293.1 Predicted thiol-disulfide oxidoreductase YuxK, DCC family [Sediminibacterium ginsengisoli]
MIQKHHQITNPVIIFDGVCNLCNRSVRFVIKHDPHKHFRFASLQSDAARQFLAAHDTDAADSDSFILAENGRVSRYSTAALKVCRQLNGLWPLLYGLIIIPPFIRNAVYRYVARNRYKWFGRRDSCMIPSADTSDRFL